MILGHFQRPDERLDGLVQVLQRREETITASGLSQRFTKEAADYLNLIPMGLDESAPMAPWAVPG